MKEGRYLVDFSSSTTINKADMRETIVLANNPGKINLYGW